MSLINKMLQDLDARGTPAGDSMHVPIKPVERVARGVNLRMIGFVAAGLVAGLGLAWVALSQWQQRHAAAPGPKVVATVTPAPAKPAAVAPRPAAPAIPATPVPAPAPVTTVAAAAEDAPAPAPLPHKERHKKPHKVPTATQAGAPAAAAAAKSVAPLEPDSAEARAARRALAVELDARGYAHKAFAPPVKPRRAARTVAPADETPVARSTSQRAESEYRRALAAMQDGRMTDTITALESALRIEPGHEAARQTLVGLLVEAGRNEDAMRQLQLGLSLDPRQPALAMLLARLQIEHGEGGLQRGIDTLMRTLPYAGNDPDYHGFLAGALQRQQRQHEAAEQYTIALRGAPGNAVWWMGLGLSLQADKRNAEALDAFRKARAAGLPSQELQTFVERRIQLLER